MREKRLCRLWYGLNPSSVCENAELTFAQVLADSFETRFSPFTLEKPRVSQVSSCSGLVPSSYRRLLDIVGTQLN